MNPLRGTDPAHCKRSDCSQCTFRLRTCQSGCKRCRRCKRYHRSCSGSSIDPCWDHSFPPHDIDRGRRRSPDCFLRTSRIGSCPFEYKHCHRCIPSHPVCSGSNKFRCWGHMPLPRGTDRALCRRRDCSQHTFPLGSYRIECTHCRRYTVSHPPLAGWSMSRSQGRTSPQHGTGRTQNTQPDLHPCKFRRGKYRSDYMRSRHCSPFRRASMDYCKCLCSGHSCQQNDTDRAPRTARGLTPRTRRCDRCRSEYTRLRHRTPSHQALPDWSTSLCSDRNCPQDGIGRAQCM
jgi:hypothetical protein